MKAIQFENVSEALRSMVFNIDAELQRMRHELDNAAEVVTKAEAAEDQEAIDKAMAEYSRINHVIEDLRNAAESLYTAAHAFDGLEEEGRDVLRNMELI